MRYSLLAVAVSCTLVLTACNKSTDTAEPAADSSSAVTTTGSESSASSSVNSDKVSMSITGAGSTFAQPLYAKWSSDYNAATGGQVNYQSIGSSGGIKQIIAGTVDFGASDAPMTPEELTEAGLIQFPTAIGGVVPVVNIKGIEPGALKLDGKTLADIYLGNISNWNDPAIAALNPDLTLPDAQITTVFRSDGSGTTFNFTDYLAKVSPEWQTSVGVDKSIKWPTSATGAAGKGNEGVSSYVGRMDNSIGYVEYAYATQNNMAHVSLKNAAGNYVQPSIESFAAAGDIDWSQEEGFNRVITDSETAEAWPIAASVFVLVHKQPKDPKQVAGVLNFFNWAYDQGTAAATELHYVPFSEKAATLFKDSWKQVVDKDGNPVYTPQ